MRKLYLHSAHQNEDSDTNAYRCCDADRSPTHQTCLALNFQQTPRRKMLKVKPWPSHPSLTKDPLHYPNCQEPIDTPKANSVTHPQEQLSCSYLGCLLIFLWDTFRPPGGTQCPFPFRIHPSPHSFIINPCHFESDWLLFSETWITLTLTLHIYDCQYFAWTILVTLWQVIDPDSVTLWQE